MSRSWNRELPAVVWLVVLAAVVSWPALALDGLVGHERCTAGCHAWVVWAAGQRLAGALPGDLLFFPHGADLVRLYGSDFVSPALLGLLGGMSSPARALDLWVVFLFASNGLAALVLARGMGLGRCPGAVVGTAYMAAPFFLHEAFNGTTELLAAAPLPLFALAWLRLLEKPSWRLGLLAGLAFGIGGLLSAYTPFFLLLLVAVSLAWWGVSHIEPLLERARVRAVALAGVVGAGVLLPVVLLHAAHGGGALHGRRVGWSAESVPLPDSAADLLGLFTARLASPPRVILQGDGTYYDYWTLGMVTIGFLVLGLALLGWWRGRPRGPWPALLVVALVVSFGPYLVAGGQVVRVAGSPVPLPALLFERLLPLWGVVSLHPYRFATLTTLALAVLAGRGVAVLAGWFEARARWMPVVLAVVVCAGVAAEGLSTRPGGWALPTSVPTESTSWAWLAEQPRGGMVLVPFVADEIGDVCYGLQVQAIHGQPWSDGAMHFRADPASLALYGDNAMVAALASPRRGPLPGPRVAADGIRGLRDAGFRYLVLDRPRFDRYERERDSVSERHDPDAVEAWLRHWAGEPLQDDGQVAVFGL